jgi:hydrogenase expression/formation protein HypC
MCQARPAEIIRVDGALAWIVDEARERPISLAALECVAVGDYVIQHAGLALERLDEADAREILALYEELASLDLVLGDGYVNATECRTSQRSIALYPVRLHAQSLALLWWRRQPDTLRLRRRARRRRGVTPLLQKFTGPLPCLRLNAWVNGIADPFDDRVVEAYWLGLGLRDDHYDSARDTRALQ